MHTCIIFINLRNSLLNFLKFLAAKHFILLLVLWVFGFCQEFLSPMLKLPFLKFFLKSHQNHLIWLILIDIEFSSF